MLYDNSTHGAGKAAACALPAAVRRAQGPSDPDARRRGSRANPQARSRRRRLTVSHLIRNTLEDAFNLVEGVTKDVGQLVTGSVELAAAVSRDAKRIASIVRGQKAPDDSTPAEADSQAELEIEVGDAPASAEADPLAHVYGWNRVIANRESACSKCKAAIERGDDALVGISDDSSRPRAWRCSVCAESL